MTTERTQLKELRVSLHLTQTQAGRLAGRKQKWVCDLEKGLGGARPSFREGVKKLIRAYKRLAARQGYDSSSINEHALCPDLFPLEMKPIDEVAA